MRHVGELEGHALELADLLAELARSTAYCLA